MEARQGGPGHQYDMHEAYGAKTAGPLDLESPNQAHKACGGELSGSGSTFQREHELEVLAYLQLNPAAYSSDIQNRP